MSWRQPAPTSASATTINAEHAERAENVFSADSASSAFNVVGSIGNCGDLPRVQGLEKVPRLVDVELHILRFDAQEEAIAAGEREARDVEHGVIRLRQTVQREHAEHAR